MEVLIFLGFIIYAIVSSAKKTKEVESVDTPSLDDIFNEVTKAASNKKAADTHNGGFSAYIKSVDTNYPRGSAPSQKAKKPKKQEKAPSRESLVKATIHSGSDHDCEEVNYDKMDSLMGKEESFNLASKARPRTMDLPVGEFRMGREDLLRSFIMSEVLQRYDINRIYSRIPAVKSDD